MLEEEIEYKGDKGVPVIRDMGNAVKVHTGLWRTHRPIIDYKKCIRCKICWLYCPVTAIKWDKRPIVDYDYCKGCWICFNECPVKAITMIPER